MKVSCAGLANVVSLDQNIKLTNNYQSRTIQKGNAYCFSITKQNVGCILYIKLDNIHQTMS